MSFLLIRVYTILAREITVSVWLCKTPVREVICALTACVHTPGEANADTGYEPYCGLCQDHFALSWMRVKLAACRGPSSRIIGVTAFPVAK